MEKMKVQLKIALLYMVLQSSWHVASALVNDECAQDDTCDGKNEVCDTGRTPKVCQCSTTSMNDGTGKCVSSACSPGPTACNDIPNTICKTDTCVCDVLSEPEGDAGQTKGTCVLKECTEATQCSANDDSVKCSATENGVCMCAEEHDMPSEVSCITRGLEWSCNSNPQCAGVDAVCSDGTCSCGQNSTPVNGHCKGTIGVCETDTANSCSDTDALCESSAQKCYCSDGFVAETDACKIAVGGSCTGKEEKCVSNAVCGEDKQCACNEGYTPDGSFCTGPGDRSGGSTKRPFVGAFLVLAVVATLRIWN